MGCNSDKGEKVTVEVETISFEPTGVPGMDLFFHRVSKLLEHFGELVEPLKEARHNFLHVTNFWDTPGAKTLHAVKGMLLTCGVLSNGDMNKMEITVISSNPFI